MKTPAVKIRQVALGGKNPIVIQSMTNTDTADPRATAKQCIRLADAGSELVRFTVNNAQAAAAVPQIRKILDKKGYSDLPLIGDFHYNGDQLLEEFPEMAKTLDKYRINPGNVGYGKDRKYNFEKIIKIAIKNRKPVRIGVNWGSLDQKVRTEMMEKNAKRKTPKTPREIIIDAMIESALRSAALAEKLGLPQNKIVLSVKMSEVQDVIKAYEKLSAKMQKSKHVYALHLGLTEAGGGMQGTVSSSAAMAILLQQGIGDTIRISLTPEPGNPRTLEVEACKHLLQSMGLRHFRPKVTSCPGCGRTDGDLFQKLAKRVNEHIDKNLAKWKSKHKNIEKLHIAVMGCVVNGPGESSHSDIAICIPGRASEEKTFLDSVSQAARPSRREECSVSTQTDGIDRLSETKRFSTPKPPNEKPMATLYIKGKFVKTLQGRDIDKQFIRILDEFLKTNA